MICTEDEARQKWCPFARVVSADAHGQNGSVTNYNRLDLDGKLHIPDRIACIGSGCMLWDWYDPHTAPERRGYCSASSKPLGF